MNDPEPDPFPILETGRLVLREIVADDAPALFAIHSDVEAMRWFGTVPLREPAQADVLVTRFAEWRRQPNPGTRWGLQRKGGGALIGRPYQPKYAA